MQFPTWTRRRGLSRQQQSARRLRYMLYRLACEVCETPTLRNLCGQAQIDHSTVACAMRKGRFSEQLASAFESHFGHKLVKKEYLTDPMSIKAE